MATQYFTIKVRTLIKHCTEYIRLTYTLHCHIMQIATLVFAGKHKPVDTHNLIVFFTPPKIIGRLPTCITKTLTPKDYW